MKPEAQLVALLEWMGWKNVGPSPAVGVGLVGLRPNPESPMDYCECDEFTLDLLHEATIKLDRLKLQRFRSVLQDVCAVSVKHSPPRYLQDYELIHATKEQRLEALLKTVGLWVESEVAK